MNIKIIEKIKSEKNKNQTTFLWILFDEIVDHLIYNDDSPLDWTFKEFRDFVWWMIDKGEIDILIQLLMDSIKIDFIMQLISDIKITLSKEMMSMFLLSEATMIFKYDKIISTIKRKYSDPDFESDLIDKDFVDSWENSKIPSRDIKILYEKYLNTQDKTKRFEEVFDLKILDTFHVFREFEIKMKKIRNCFMHPISLFETIDNDYSIINFTYGDKLSKIVKEKSKLIPRVKKENHVAHKILNILYDELDEEINFSKGAKNDL